MSREKKEDGYKTLTAAIAADRIENLYIFHGEERYLLERSLAQLRQRLCPEGLDSFNYKRFEGKDVTLGVLGGAIEALPVFADRSLVEIHDFDIFKSEEKPRLADMFADLPDYICVVFVYDTVTYKPDGRKKLDSGLLKHAKVVEFSIQTRDKLVKWIKRHFEDAGKRIGTSDAEYLALMTGGLMTTLHNEIEKAAAFAKDETVTRSDIDAVVIPTVDTASYKLSDALLRHDYTGALRVLEDLFHMREAPHKLIFSISLKMRQLLAARVCIENNLDKTALMEICGMPPKYEFQARALIATARKTTLTQCLDAALACSETAYALNTGSDPEARIVELITKLAFADGARA